MSKQKEKKGILRTKSFQLAVRIVKMYKHLSAEKKDYTISRQDIAFRHKPRCNGT